MSISSLITLFPLASALLFAFVTFLVSHQVTNLLIGVFTQRGILDHPNSRSSHQVPTPYGGGIGLLSGLLPSWLALSFLAPNTPIALPGVICAGIFLAVTSWIDDRRGLHPIPRLFVQSLCIALVLFLGPFKGPIFGGFLPPYFDTFAAAILWLWFINLFNFMDGIDGLASVQTAAIGIGVFITAKIGNLEGHWLALGLTTSAAAIGFLRWNWHPAKIFMGDVGSATLGFLLGWLLLSLAAAGHPVPALILPLYFFADATLTLFRRMTRGEAVWRAHKEHFYQMAIQSGLRHDQVSGIVSVCCLFMIALTMVAMRGLPSAALVGALAAVALLLFLLAKGGPTE
tara:strand:+ start:2515 stop:3543 length:1029 start_codon:yes stop_codon:yes gene_type:complete